MTRRAWNQELAHWKEVAEYCQRVTDAGWTVFSTVPVGGTPVMVIVIAWKDEPDLSRGAMR